LQDSKPTHSSALEQAALSPHTAIKAIDAWLTIAKFVYLQEIEQVGWKNKSDIPALAALYRLRRNATKCMELHRHTTHPRKEMNWTEFLELGEVLREECKPWFPQSTQSQKNGTTRGTLRSPTAIAQSYQRFLLVGLLSYLPPQRLGEIRATKIELPLVTNSKPITRKIDPEESLLYREGNQWWLKMISGKFKTRATSARSIPLPNLRYDNDRCFYQYLEEWLLHYEYRDHQGETVALPGLRSCFNPQHDYLFTLKNGQPYSLPALRMLLRQAAHRVTAKPLVPVRNMFIEHIRTYPLSDVEKENLMLSMGHYPKQLLSKFEPECKLPQTNRQLAAEIAQAFINQKRKGKPPLQKMEPETLNLP
jgi:hypothetical protein